MKISAASKSSNAKKSHGKDSTAAHGLKGGRDDGKSHGLVDGLWVNLGCSMLSWSTAPAFLGFPSVDLGWDTQSGL